MIKIIYEQKENRAAAYDDEKFIGESTYAKSDKVWIIDHFCGKKLWRTGNRRQISC